MTTSPHPKSDRAPAPDADRELFDGVREGDAGAFETLFRRYVDRLCAFAFVYTQERDAAEEIVQETFLWLWEHRSAISEPRSVPGYLHGAVRNRAFNTARDHTTELRIYERGIADNALTVVPQPLEAPDALAEAGDLKDALGRAIAEMPLRCREVFTLARAQSLTYAEIAAVLGISPKTVEIHMSRALSFLRERLAPWLST